MNRMVSLHFQLKLYLAIYFLKHFDYGYCEKMNETFFISDDLLQTISNASTGNIVMPPGCSCMKSNVLSHNCDAFECSCLCDMNAGVCDYNCCCDEECTDDEINRFETCVDSGLINSRNKMCYETGPWLDKINPVYPIKKSNAPKGTLHSLLCIEHDNSAVKGEFFDHIEYPSAFDSTLNHMEEMKADRFSDDNHLTMQSFRDFFHFGDIIPAFMGRNVSNRQQLVDAFGRKMVIPAAGDGGFCHDMNAVRFGENSRSSCVRLINDAEKECEKELSIDRFISNIYIGKKQNMKSPHEIDDIENQNLLKIVLSKVIHKYEKLDVVTYASTKISKWNASMNVCQKALRGLSYQILYHTNGTISQVSVVATATDISNNKPFIEQEFSITFEPVDMFQAQSVSSSNYLIPRRKSGNPGYRFGYPTLAAKKFVSKNSTLSFRAFVNGLSIMNMGSGGQCQTVDPSATVVGFGIDYRVSCNIKMNLNELEQMCSSSSHQYLQEIVVGEEKRYLPRWMVSISDYVGIFGNADPLDKSQWLPIYSAFDEPAASLKNRVWLPSENKCEGLTTQLEYDFLWTHVGNKERPQAKIISARKRFLDDRPLVHLMGDLPQNYEFVATVTWTYVRPKDSVIKPSPPSLLFSVPYDVFYPFFMDQSSSFVISLRVETKYYFSVILMILFVI